MPVHLKGIVLGDSETGKSSFLQAICSNKANLQDFQVETIDPATKTSLVFHLEEANQFLNGLTQYPCIFLMYSLANYASFLSVKENWLPQVLSTIKNDFSFIIIIGTHNDLINEREVDSQEAEEFATSNGVFHMEISSINRRNIELTLKVMRIRATYLIKKHPEMTDLQPENDFVNISSPKASEISEEVERNVDIIDEFSLYHIEENNLHLENEFNKCQNIITDIPMSFSDYKEMKKKKDRYEKCKDGVLAEIPINILNEKSKAQVFEENISFANISEISKEEFNFSETVEDFFPDAYENMDRLEDCPINIETLGSPSWQKQRKVPPLTIISQPSMISMCPPKTERRTAPNTQINSGHNTERIIKDPLLFLDVKTKDGIKRINVYPGDTAQNLAETILGNCPEAEDLGNLIENEINKYCNEIRSIQNSKKNKILYKVNVRLGEKALEIVVKEGDKVEDLAKKFVESNKLSRDVEATVFKLLIEAEKRQKKSKAI
ncbi:unnamed protein product [Blepharisma stoltei]|uniref:Uncharacterized protein n=1 Tax=Blepharisma stoltei TaxID=1481888 RepID=A0AAU9ITH3_9CILI|nr:unnamed protein product [Blepharisma stoltei]